MAQNLFDHFAKAPSRAVYRFVRRSGATEFAASDLFATARAISQDLRLDHLPKGANVGLLLRSQQQQTLLYLACLSAGLTPAILTPFHTRLSKGVFEDSLGAVLKASILNILISDAPLSAAPGREEVLRNNTKLFVADLSPPTGAQDQRLLQFSSGTTGLKKCIEIQMPALHAQLETYGRAIGISADDVVLSWLPLYHDMGFIASLNLALFSGASATYIETLDWLAEPKLFVTEAHNQKATLSWNPNFFFSFMAKRVAREDVSGLSLAHLRGLINCSEPTTLRAQALFRERFGQLGLRSDVFWGCYAMAETTFALTHMREDEAGYADGRTLSVGSPLPSVDLHIVDENGAPLPDGEIGEIRVASPFNFSGYAGAAQVDPDANFATGDLGYRRGERYFVVGRKNDRIAINGDKIYAHDVEECVSVVDGVIPGRVCAFGAFDEFTQSEKLVILAEVEGDAEQFKTSAIKSIVAQTFNVTSLDVTALVRGTLQKSSSGKISRARCREWWQARTQKA